MTIDPATPVSANFEALKAKLREPFELVQGGWTRIIIANEIGLAACH